MIYTVIATGPSLTKEDVEYVRRRSHVIAVSNSYNLAPWGDALVSCDAAWWNNNPDAYDFPGLKFCKNNIGSARSLPLHLGLPAACNSGLAAMYLAKDMGAKKILLLGFDMHGSHYFGKHPEPLKNTSHKTFQIHINQFKRWSSPDVINCTPGSSLTKFPYMPLRDVI